MEPFTAAVLLTSLAGAATAVGGALGALGRPISDRGLAVALGLASGVMLAVSAAEMLPAAAEGLDTADAALLGVDLPGPPLACLALAAGVLVYLAVDRLLPEAPAATQAEAQSRARDARLGRIGVVTALAIGAHNVPEGFVTFAGTLEDPRIGVALALAMAVHNVPEGIAVAVPVRRATGSRHRALAWATAAGVAEPLGALLGFLLLAPVLTPAVLGAVYGGVAGVMCALSIDALLPEARRAGGAAATGLGLALGAAVMAASLAALG